MVYVLEHKPYRVRRGKTSAARAQKLGRGPGAGLRRSSAKVSLSRPGVERRCASLPWRRLFHLPPVSDGRSLLPWFAGRLPPSSRLSLSSVAFEAPLEVCHAKDEHRIHSAPARLAGRRPRRAHADAKAVGGEVGEPYASWLEHGLAEAPRQAQPSTRPIENYSYAALCTCGAEFGHATPEVPPQLQSAA